MLDKAQSKFVEDQAWNRKTIQIVRDIAKGTVFTSDLVQAIAKKKGHALPSHWNRWGMALKAAKKISLVRPTGKYVASARKAAHRRVVAEWIRL
ncbi:MAG: hypothetical protein ACOYB3_01230 [Azonexus sp.]